MSHLPMPVARMVFGVLAHLVGWWFPAGILVGLLAWAWFREKA